MDLDDPLTKVQQRQLELFKTFFFSFEKQCLGKNPLIKDRIDVSNSKQRFYAVSHWLDSIHFSYGWILKTEIHKQF